MKLIVIFIGLFHFSFVSAQTETVYPVSLAQVTAYTEQQLSWFNATVISSQNIKISTESTGRITWIAEFGRKLKKGDLLAKIDDKSLQLKLKYQQQVVRKAEEDSIYRQQELKRLESMKKVQGISQNQVDLANHEYQMALIELEQQKITLETIQLDIKKTHIHAPFNGVVEVQHLQTGEYAESGQVLITLVDKTKPEIKLFAPINLVNHLSSSAVLPIKQAKQQGKAKLLARSYSADEKSRQLELRLTPQNPEIWNIGQALQVALPESISKDTMAIPRDALVVDQKGKAIFRMDESRKVERIPVTVLSGNDTSVAITGDIKIGDQVVVRGSGMLKTGDEVNPI